MARSRSRDGCSSKYRRVVRQPESGRYLGSVPAGGKKHAVGTWSDERDAAIAVDRAILHFELDEPLNVPNESRRLGPLSPDELRREALRKSKEERNTSRYFGVRRVSRHERWTVDVRIGTKFVGIYCSGTEEDAAVIYDRIARSEGELLRLNFPDRDLRPATVAEIRQELFVLRRAARSGSKFRGVAWSTKWHRWHATVRVDGEERHLGYWDDERAAALAHDCAALFLFGAATFRNFPRARVIPTSIADLRAEAHALVKARTTSRYAGVHWQSARAKWFAVFEHRGRKHSLGMYDDEKDAAHAIDRVAAHFLGSSAPRNLRRRRVEPATPAKVREEVHALFKERTTSRYTGVWWSERKQRWKATLTVDHRVYHLGYHREELDAAEAYDRAARRLRGPGRLNFPE